MKDRPILFNGAMVRAILAGTKTQTRRLLKPPRSLGFIGCCCGGSAARWVAEGDRWHCGTCGGGARLTTNDVEYLRCPYGQPGDRLWVRETFAHIYRDNTLPDARRDDDVAYKADHPGLDEYAFGSWKPSIHMPRWASRITPEITSVRVERLNDISEADALAEGSRDWAAEQETPVRDLDEARLQFRALWTAINGGESWDANPWVWVVEFKRVEQQR